MLPADALRARFESFGVTSDKNVVIHCQTGEASAHSYFALRLIGYPRVRTYHRSWAEWSASDDLPKATIDS
ncbi:MAG: rhodanese-like domain-containing protein [Devosia sp.]